MSRIRSISIGLRLALAFGAVCAACLVVALVGYTGATGLQTQTHHVEDGARTQQLLGGLNEDIALNADAVVRHLYVLDGDLKAQDAMQKEIEARWPDISAALAEIKQIHPDDVAAVDAIAAQVKPYRAAVTEAIATSRQETIRNVEERDGSRTQYTDAVLPAYEKLDAAAEEVIAKFNADLQGSVDAAEQLLGAGAVLDVAGALLQIGRAGEADEGHDEAGGADGAEGQGEAQADRDGSDAGHWW